MTETKTAFVCLSSKTNFAVIFSEILKKSKSVFSGCSSVRLDTRRETRGFHCSHFESLASPAGETTPIKFPGYQRRAKMDEEEGTVQPSRQWTVCGCCCVCVLFMRASVRLCGGGGSAMIQWCCDFKRGPRTGGLFSPVALWVTVQSSLGRAVRAVRLRNERRWESKTQSRTEPWWTDLSAATTQARAGEMKEMGGDTEKMEIYVGGGRKERERKPNRANWEQWKAKTEPRVWRWAEY